MLNDLSNQRRMEKELELEKQGNLIMDLAITLLVTLFFGLSVISGIWAFATLKHAKDETDIGALYIGVSAIFLCVVFLGLSNLCFFSRALGIQI